MQYSQPFSSPKNFSKAISQTETWPIPKKASPKNLNTPSLSPRSPREKLPSGSPKTMFTELLAASKLKSQPLTEDQIKKKLLANVGPDKEQTLETFKKYLQALIERKVTGNKSQQSTEKKISPEELLKQRLKSTVLRKQSTQSEHRKETIEDPLEKEDEGLTQAQLNQEKIIMTSKKLRDRMRTEKVDKASKFYKNKIKQFSNLDTFINAKEFFEDLNPFKEFNPERQTGKEFQVKKHLMTIKKLQKESNDFYDKKIKEFTDRMTELNKENVEIKDFSESRSSKTSKTSSDLSQMMREDRQNPTKIEMNPFNVISSTRNIRHSLKDLQEMNFSDNMNFLEKQLGMNKSVVEFFKQFYDPNGQIKKNKQTVSEIDKVRTSIMRHLLFTDNTLNRLEFQQEGNDDFNQLDGFYSQTLEVLTREKNLKKTANGKNEELDLDSLMRLEKLLETILLHKNRHKAKKVKAEEESVKKYEDFKEKTNKLLGLIDKTSRTIFNEKHKEFTTSVNKRVKAYQRRSMGSISTLKKSAALGIYLTSVDPDDSLSKVKVSGPVKSPSISFPVSAYFEKEDVHPFTIDSHLNSHKKRLSVYESKRYDTEINTNTHTLLPAIKKKAMRTISSIIERTGVIQDVYRKERKNIGELENECNKFFKEAKNRINPPLESILMTMDKPNTHFKFNAFKKCKAVRKHYI